MKINKQEIVELLCAELQKQFESMVRASRSAREAATDGESKAESKYDTFGLESSYLARGQAEQAEQLAETIKAFKLIDFSELPKGSGVASGALIEAELGDETVFYLFAPRAGGLTCEYKGRDVTVITRESPIGKKLLGSKAGDQIEQPEMTIMSIY